MDLETLIECVRDYSCLYNLEDKVYSDNERKELAWREIGRLMGRPAPECKKQWNSLRDSFRRSLKKKKESTKLSQGVTKIKKWKFDDEMGFLLPHIKERESINSANVECSNDSNSESERALPMEPPSEGTSICESLFTQNQEEEAPPIKQPTPSQRMIRKKYFLKKNVPLQAASGALMKYFITNKSREHTVQVPAPLDDVDHIFLGMAATVKKLSPYNQAIAKARVFSVVSELEIGDIKQTLGSDHETPMD